MLAAASSSVATLAPTAITAKPAPAAGWCRATLRGRLETLRAPIPTESTPLGGRYLRRVRIELIRSSRLIRVTLAAESLSAGLASRGPIESPRSPTEAA